MTSVQSFLKDPFLEHLTALIMAKSPVPAAETADFVERRECHSPGIPEVSARKSKYSPARKRRKTSGKTRKQRRLSSESRSSTSSSASEGEISNSENSSSS